MKERRLSSQEQSIEGLEEYASFREREKLERFIASHGIGPNTPKSILYAFRDDLSSHPWEDRQARYFSQPCSVGALLESIADKGAFMSDTPNDFTVGLVLRIVGTDSLVAIRYSSEECELIDREDDVVVDESGARVFDYIRTYEAAICQDHTKLFWAGHSLIEE